MIDFSTSTLCSFYPLKSIEDYFDQNSPARHWINIKFSGIILGLADLRARQGFFSTPWNAVSIYQSPMPDLSIANNEHLHNLMDSRAQEIYKQSLESNKKIVILWSGGIDSTSVLVSMLKNIPYYEQAERLIVCLSPDSIIENFLFYKKFISNRIPTVHKFKININNDFLKKHIVLSGEPGDALFGPSIGKYQHLINEKYHDLNYKDHRNLLLECVNLFGHTSFKKTGEWLIDKINYNLEETLQPGIVTIADWFWWQYINFKWEGSVWKPIHSTFRHEYNLPIDQVQANEYLNNTFFNTVEFQRWSFTNKHNFFPTGASSHKHQIKKYIFEFDKNESYYKYKVQTASISSDIVNGTQHHLLNRPVMYDQDWVGYTLQNSEVKNTVINLLHQYQG